MVVGAVQSASGQTPVSEGPAKPVAETHSKDIKELIAYSTTRRVTYAGSTGIGGPVHLGMERLAQLSGAKWMFVPYKGSAPSILAAMSGEVNMAAGSSMAATAAVRTGKVRALAALGLTRIPSMPDLPTVAEQGFPGLTVGDWGRVDGQDGNAGCNHRAAQRGHQQGAGPAQGARSVRPRRGRASRRRSGGHGQAARGRGREMGQGHKDRRR